jgi:hypothetical protein
VLMLAALVDHRGRGVSVADRSVADVTHKRHSAGAGSAKRRCWFSRKSPAPMSMSALPDRRVVSNRI